MRALIIELREWVDGVYGAYMDAMSAFSLLHARFVAGQREHVESIEKARASDPSVRFGGASFGYARLVKAGTSGDSLHQHHVPYQDAISRNAHDGSNSRYIGQMAIVSIFGFWNDHTRLRLEEELLWSRDSLKVPIFGDLRHLRDLIVHNHARADERVRRLEVLRWVKEGDLIAPGIRQIEEIVDAVFQFTEAFDADPKTFHRE